MKKQTTSAAREAACRAIARMGGPVAAARLLEQCGGYQAIQSWRMSGVPVRHCVKVSEATGMTVQELRPDDWQLYWPVLEAA